MTTRQEVIEYLTNPPAVEYDDDLPGVPLTRGLVLSRTSNGHSDVVMYPDGSVSTYQERQGVAWTSRKEFERLDALIEANRAAAAEAAAQAVDEDQPRLRVRWTKVESDTCGVCHLPLVPDAIFTLGKGDLRATTVGHEPPKTHCWANGLTKGVTRPEHWACNRWKSDRIDSRLPNLPKELIDIVTSAVPVYEWSVRVWVPS